jgi:signal transduction histidine kinase
MQVLINLISNAIKYSFKGTVTIEAHADPGHRRVVVSVSDTGIGMSREQQAHLFEKFYRVDTKETAGIGGTGLGLYITRSILERMDGRVDLKSTPGKGSTFTITLPISQQQSGARS